MLYFMALKITASTIVLGMLGLCATILKASHTLIKQEINKLKTVIYYQIFGSAVLANYNILSLSIQNQEHGLQMRFSLFGNKDSYTLFIFLVLRRKFWKKIIRENTKAILITTDWLSQRRYHKVKKLKISVILTPQQTSNLQLAQRKLAVYPLNKELKLL